MGPSGVSAAPPPGKLPLNSAPLAAAMPSSRTSSVMVTSPRKITSPPKSVCAISSIIVSTVTTSLINPTSASSSVSAIKTRSRISTVPLPFRSKISKIPMRRDKSSITGSLADNISMMSWIGNVSITLVMSSRMSPKNSRNDPTFN